MLCFQRPGWPQSCQLSLHLNLELVCIFYRPTYNRNIDCPKTKAYVTCKGVGQVLLRFSWAIHRHWMRCFGPIDQPSLQPVTLNVLPALPMVTVLSHIPGRVAATRQKIFLLHSSIPSSGKSSRKEHVACLKHDTITTTRPWRSQKLSTGGALISGFPSYPHNPLLIYLIHYVTKYFSEQ